MNVSENQLPRISAAGEFSDDRLAMVTPCVRMSDVRTVICGQSHNTAVWRALVTPGDDGRPTRAMEIAVEAGLASLPRPRTWPDYDRAVASLGRDRHVVLIWGGSQANADFLMMPGRPFDVVPRGYGAGDILPAAQVVPESMMRAHFEPSTTRLAAILEALGRPTGQKRIVLGIQPPLADETQIRLHLAKRKGYFFDKSQGLGVDPITVPLAPASLRRKLWFILMELYREQAERYGALFLPSPASAADSGGFLRPELSGEDGTHANVRYGRLLIEHLAPHVA
jgi:hypothetical protein